MIRLLNTLSGEKEELKPRKGKKIEMFVCGPTVYDYIHIGNARTFVVFDVIAKYLRYQDFKVNYIQNITDIDDALNYGCPEEGFDGADTQIGNNQSYRCSYNHYRIELFGF